MNEISSKGEYSQKAHLVHMKRALIVLFVAAVVGTGTLHLVTDRLKATPDFRVFVDGDAVYRVTYDSLVDAGLPRRGHDPDTVSLTHMGQPVPVRVVSKDGAKKFGPGGWLEFRAERITGQDTYFHGHSPFNVYQLRWLDTPTARPIDTHDAGREAEGATRFAPIRVQHLEKDHLLVRVSARDLPEDQDEPELWFWHKLTHVDKKPFVTEVDLSDFDPARASPITVRVRFHGLSQGPYRKRDAEPIPDHEVEILLNNTVIGTARWNGKKAHLFEIEQVDPKLVRADTNRLKIRVPQRFAPEADEAWVDVAVVDWLELRYATKPRVSDPQMLVDLEAGSRGDIVALSAEATTLVAYGDAGSRVVAVPFKPAEIGRGATFRFEPRAGETSYQLVADSAFAEPTWIEVDRPSTLRSSDRQADYLMIAHRTLIDSIEPLAAFHRRRGLAVDVIDVQDVYDEFNGGIVHPSAIRDFVTHAHSQWQAPQPQFVLLVGDASWDTKNSTADDSNYANWVNHELLRGGGRFVDNLDQGVQAYEGENAPSLRALIPTWNYASFEGHSASDNYFAAIEGDDMFPDLAVGRFPVIDPAEVTAIVDKTIRYADRSEVGPWRRNILWITNEERSFQRRTDRAALAQQERGFAAVKVYPQPSEEDNSAHQRALQSAFEEGQLLVHFFGHGGRHIWRTGPPDFRKNHDLFTIDHVDTLAPSNRLPVVLSMTCYSAPFDHPSADSIGEKFLRAPNRGAVAVFAASWRNNPSSQFSDALFRELTVPGVAIGTAIMRAKQSIRSANLVQSYNLLGDPAIPLALPQLEVEVGPDDLDDPTAVVARVDDRSFRGKAIIEWLDEAGTVVTSIESEMSKGVVRAALEAPVDTTKDATIDPATIHGVQVYVWNQRKDGMGYYGLEQPEAEPQKQDRAAPSPANTANTVAPAG